VLEVFGNFHDVLGVVDEVLRQKAVTKIDAALEVDFVAGDVVPADQVENRLTRSPNRAGDIISGPELLDVVSNLDHLAEAFVPDHQVLAAGRGIAIKRFVDFAVRRIDADLQHLHQNPAAISDFAHMRMRLVRNPRDGNLSYVHTIRLAGQYGY